MSASTETKSETVRPGVRISRTKEWGVGWETFWIHPPVTADRISSSTRARYVADKTIGSPHA